MSLNKKTTTWPQKKNKKNTSSAPFSHQKRETKNEVREAAAWFFCHSTRICKKFWVPYCDWASWIKLSYQRFTQKNITCIFACIYIYIILVNFTMNIYDHITYMNIHIYILVYHILHTSTGRNFALVEGLSHDLVCAGSNDHVHFALHMWHGQHSPGFEFNRLKSFSRVEIDRNHVDLKDSRGKGFALPRLNKHNFCPASVYAVISNVFYILHVTYPPEI